MKMVGPWLPKAGLFLKVEAPARKQEGQAGESHRSWLPCGPQEISLGAEEWWVGWEREEGTLGRRNRWACWRGDDGRQAQAPETPAGLDGAAHSRRQEAWRARR